MVLLTASAADVTADPATDRNDPTRPGVTRRAGGHPLAASSGAPWSTGRPVVRPARRRRPLAVLAGLVGRVVVILGIVGAVLMVAAPSAVAVVLGRVGANGAAVLVVIVVLAVYVVVAAEQRVPRWPRGGRREPGGPFDAVSRLPFSFDRCQDPGALRSVLARFLTDLGYVDVSVEPHDGGPAPREGAPGVLTIGLVHPQDGEPEGRVRARWPGQGRPPAEVAAVAGRAAALAALALRRLRHERDREWQASLDHLTGLPNRRALAAALHRELASAEERGSVLGLVVLDVDHFKTVNDRDGHGVGDRVLTELAAGLQAASRGDDLVARLGGDEFAAVLPDITADTLGEITERIRTAVAAAVTTRQVTVSAGAAAVPDDGRVPTSLIEAADRALYRAKRSGRNQTCTAAIPEAPAAAVDDVVDDRGVPGVRGVRGDERPGHDGC